MMIPLDFPMDGTLRLFPAGFLGFSAYEHGIGALPQNPAVPLIGRDAEVMDPRTSLRELMDDAIMIFSCGVKPQVEKVTMELVIQINSSSSRISTLFTGGMDSWILCYVFQGVGLERRTEEYVRALDPARLQLSKPNLSGDERSEVVKSIEIFEKKLDE